jgi:hypothetical protein
MWQLMFAFRAISDKVIMSNLFQLFDNDAVHFPQAILKTLCMVLVGAKTKPKYLIIQGLWLFTHVTSHLFSIYLYDILFLSLDGKDSSQRSKSI